LTRLPPRGAGEPGRKPAPPPAHWPGFWRSSRRQRKSFAAGPLDRSAPTLPATATAAARAAPARARVATVEASCARAVADLQSHSLAKKERAEKSALFYCGFVALSSRLNRLSSFRQPFGNGL
jgi:hypothetical protein